MLRLVARGVSNTDIASTLFLSPGTVRNLVSTACAKVNAPNKIKAVRIAEQEGWI